MNDNKYKQLVFNIPRGKWGCLPSACKDIDQEVFVLSHLYKDTTPINSQFISINKVGNIVSSVSNLYALNCIKTTSNDNNRIIDNVSVKQPIISKAGSLDKYAAGHYQEITLKGQQKQIMDILVAYHYPFETIRQVRDSFQTNNFLYKKNIDMFLRQIIKAKKENKIFQAHLYKLIQIAQSIDEEPRQFFLLAWNQYYST